MFKNIIFHSCAPIFNCANLVRYLFLHGKLPDARSLRENSRRKKPGGRGSTLQTVIRDEYSNTSKSARNDLVSPAADNYLNATKLLVIVSKSRDSPFCAFSKTETRAPHASIGRREINGDSARCFSPRRFCYHIPWRRVPANKSIFRARKEEAVTNEMTARARALHWISNLFSMRRERALHVSLSRRSVYARGSSTVIRLY